ncbi:ExeA family protein [Hydrogenophaga sp.]|uniref:ExeA family protein n=1 Tax=Hydrogenophaga sp. TaxID=1904254 RepID=UPI00286D7543|nr:AAA family ATPase [Hydrogenophaga sp.]
MYSAYFGLSQPPFSIAPDPRYLYMSQRHREALAHLVYGMQAGGGFVLLTGDIGSGKTTVCRCLLEQTPEQVQLAYIFNPKLDAIELLHSICEEFRIPLPDGATSIKALIAPLNAFLLQAHARGQRCVLIIDEAQNLATDVLEQLRLLTNLETREHKLLQIVLIGQPELRDMLEDPALEQLAQRVIARYHLQALDLPDTRQYVQHRLTVAGLKGPSPFTERALRRIHQLARGVPRRINLLCDRALLGAYARRLRQVDTALVDLAATEVLGRAPARRWPSATAWGIGLLALGVVLAGAWTLERRPTPLSSAARPARPMAAPPAAAPAIPPATPTAEPPLTDRAPALASLRDDQNAALQDLGQRWGLDLPAKNLCDAALAARVQCFRTTDLTLAGLRQLNRPGLLLLHDQGVSRWVEALALDGEQLVLRAGEQRWRQPLAALPSIWQGGYASFWRLPAGQQARVFVASPQDPAGQWLDQQLLRLQAQGTLAADARDFTARVRAFQRLHGLNGDGKALPSTFLLVNRLAGVDEPPLQPLAR